jgi:hypothetical protein
MAFFTPAQIDQLSGRVVRVALLVEFQFASGTKRVWEGNTELESGGHTWLPLRGMGSIEGLTGPGGGGTAAEAVTFRVSGIPNDASGLLAEALSGTNDALQRLVTIYLQLFDDDWQPHSVPIGVWWGFMQPPKVSRTEIQGTEGATQSVEMQAENAFFNRSRPPFGRYTDRDQQARSPGDRFFQFVGSLLFKKLNYPAY